MFLLGVAAHILPIVSSFQQQLPGRNNIEAFLLTNKRERTTRRYSVPVLDEWKFLPNGRIEGRVSNHPNIEDGAIISTSPVSLTPEDATTIANNVVVIETTSGSQYLLRNPSIGAISGLNADYSADFPMVSSSTDWTNNNNNNNENNNNNNKVAPEVTNEAKNLLQKVKDAGVAGVISYAFWELGFWAVSISVCIAAYRQVTGHWPDFSNQEDLKQLGAEAFAFVNVARFAVPIRIGLALSTAPWIQTNIVDRFSSNKKNDIIQ